MGVLDTILRIRAAEEQRDKKDIESIGTTVTQFINQNRQREIDTLNKQSILSQIQQREFNQNRQTGVDELNRRNVESQIQSRKPSKVDQFFNETKTLEALSDRADITKQQSDIDLLNSFKQSLNPKGAIDAVNKNLDPLAQVKETTANQLDSFIQPKEPSQLPKQSIQNEQQQAIQQTVRGIPDSIPEFETTPSGRELTEKGQLQKKQAGLIITGNAAVDLQELKEGAKVRRNLSAGDLKLDLTLTEFFNFAKEQQELLGLPAGPVAGLLSKITSSLSAEAKNKFLASFEGSRIELAAFVGRNAMPGTRAARIIDLFRETTPSPFDTISSGIRNAAVSWGETIDTDFGANPNEYIPGYTNMLFSEQAKARNEVMKPYIKEQIKIFEDTYTVQAYKVSPEIFTERDRVNAEKTVRESIRNSLRGE